MKKSKLNFKKLNLRGKFAEKFTKRKVIKLKKPKRVVVDLREKKIEPALRIFFKEGRMNT